MHTLTALACFPAITYRRLKQAFDYAQFLPNRSLFDLTKYIRTSWPEENAAEFFAWHWQMPPEKLQAELAREEIAAVALGDKNYPARLAEITDPPLVLFVRGRLPPQKQPLVAIVGTRRCTVYGRQVTEQLAENLAVRDIGIVSGLALGIDGAAHAATLAAGGYTLAVLGAGIGREAVYPASHRGLAEKIIAAGGAIISEYPWLNKPTAFSFQARNRIIAGLSLGTVVTEAPTESGALITARAALTYNREVFAVPHAITSETGVGGNNLLKQGARVVTGYQDILSELRLAEPEAFPSESEGAEAPSRAAAGSATALSELDHKILQALSGGITPIDGLIRATKLGSGEITAALTMLELKGLVKAVGGAQYTKR